MDYIELSITSEQEDADIITSHLAEIGFESFIYEQGLLKAYVPQELFNRLEADPYLQSLITAGATPTLLPHQNWNAEWESSFEPITIGEALFIGASFHQPNRAYKHHITIDPQMSFGTGHHATTRLMCHQILKCDMTYRTVFDYGCGTGILMILAKMCGATSVVGVEIDPHAAENARENISKNHVEGTDVSTGGIEQIHGQKFDLIVANINRNVIIESANAIDLALQPGGWLFMSGFLEKDVDDLKETFHKRGLQFQEHTSEDGWQCLTFRKP